MEERLYPITKTILVMSHSVEIDPNLECCFQRLFAYANEEGLNGRKVIGLVFKKHSDNSTFCPTTSVKCTVFLNEKEYEVFLEQYKNSWRAWCKEMGIDPNTQDQTIDKLSKEHKEKYE